MAHLLVGSLAHSGRWRGYLSRVDGSAASGRRAWTGSAGGWAGSPSSGGSTGWPRSASPAPGRVTATFAGVAKHYGVMIKICPPRAGHRKGVVEKVNHTAAQRWWRTLADDLTVEQAQADCDRFATVRGDTRLRRSQLR